VRVDIRAAGPADPGREDGLTLIELSMVMFMITVVFAFCLTAVVSLQQSVVRTDARTQTLDQVRLAVQQIDRQVRSGNLFYSPFSSGSNLLDLLVFTQANGNNRCVEWQVDTTNHVLQSRSWTQTWQTDGSASVAPWSTIASGVTNSSAHPPFAVDSNYGSRVLNLDITTNAKNSQSGDSEVTDSVEGRNTVYGYTTTACSTPYPATS
jgi:type II secretory pathway pseudopilin PulG